MNFGPWDWKTQMGGGGLDQTVAGTRGCLLPEGPQIHESVRARLLLSGRLSLVGPSWARLRPWVLRCLYPPPAMTPLLLGTVHILSKGGGGGQGRPRDLSQRLARDVALDDVTGF